MFNFLFSLENPHQITVLQELYNTLINGKRIDAIFGQVKLRVKRQFYTLDECTYDSVRKSIQQFVHPLHRGHD